MFTRVVQRKRPRLPALLFVGGAVLAAGLLAAVALAYVDGTATLPGGTCDVQVPNSGESKDCTTDAGANVEYIGSSADNTSSGTGLFDPFVRLQASPRETGFNTDGAVQFGTKAGKWTHAILVSGIPVVDCDGDDPGTAMCWELFVDINEGNNAKHISLNEVEIYFAGSPLLTDYPFSGAEATLQYDFTGSILINDVNQGSGRGDLRYLIPIGAGTDITIPADCDYGNAACDTWFVLYSQWGAAAGNIYASEGGFEEWKVKIYPIPTNTATQVKNTNGTAATGDDTNIADGGSVAIGTVVYDTATLGGGVTSDAGGAVTYYYQNQAVAGCGSGTPIGSAVTVTNGLVPASSTVTLSAAGTYEFWAVYSGDPPDNSPSTSPCGSETVVVGQNAPAPHSTPVVNIKDTFSVTGFAAPASTVPVLVGLYSDTTCTTQVGTDESFAVPAAGGTVTGETGFVAATAGTYSFKISYAGDANNAAFSSCVERVGITITSLP
jgi:hypothetical protein